MRLWRLFQSRRTARRIRQAVRRRRLARQSPVDSLETRVLLAAYLVTSTDASGPGTLRQAILDANANPGQDTIEFNLAGTDMQIISLTTALPAITDPVILNATPQPGRAPMAWTQAFCGVIF